MVQSNFNGDGLYFLDEPEAALSPQRQLSLLLEIYRLIYQLHMNPRQLRLSFFISEFAHLLHSFLDIKLIQIIQK